MPEETGSLPDRYPSLTARYELALGGGLAPLDGIYAILDRLEVDLVHMEIYREQGAAARTES